MNDKSEEKNDVQSEESAESTIRHPSKAKTIVLVCVGLLTEDEEEPAASAPVKVGFARNKKKRARVGYAALSAPSFKVS